MNEEPVDPELTKLLDACETANQRVGIAYAELGHNAQEDADAEAEDNRTTLLTYIATHYVRREVPTDG